MKPTLAFVDNIFHQYTMSADFFRELLSPHFEITNYWDKTSQKGPRVSVDEINKHDYVIFWQRINPISDLERITAKMIWVPMYDSLNPDYLFWKNLSFFPIKVLCFSEHIYKKCLQFGLEANYVKYWSKPIDNEISFSDRKRTVFFWNRGSVTFNEVKKVINPESIDKFILLSRPDPNYKTENISDEDARNYKIQKIEMDFKQSKEDYIKIVKSAGIFIAPRKKEGIGLSFIEAMSLGLVVVSFNEGTMNEYIKDRVTGYLFDNKNTSPIDFSDIEKIQIESIKGAEIGYSDWENTTQKITEFIELKSTKNNSALKFIWRTLYNFKLWQFKMRSKYLG